MNHISIRLEHVDFLNGLDRLHIELLQSCLKLLLVGTARLVNLLDLSSHCALAAISNALV